MASGYKMAVLGILWVINLLIIIIMAIAGGLIFKTLYYLAGMVPGTAISYDIVQYIFPAFFFFLLATLIAISYKIYQEAFAETVYVQGY